MVMLVSEYVSPDCAESLHSEVSSYSTVEKSAEAETRQVDDAQNFCMSAHSRGLSTGLLLSYFIKAVTTLASKG